mgnify:CR=1 FL=1
MKEQECVVVICSHGIDDPLVSILMLQYAIRLQQGGPCRPMLLFTEEPGEPEPSASVLKEMADSGIQWHPLRYDLKGRQFLQRMRNIAVVCWRSHWFARGKKRKVAIAFLSMAGAYASVLRSLGFHHFVLVSFEPHSRYMVELGVWRKGSMKVRASEYFERRQLRNADVVVAPTQAAVQHVRQSGSHARVMHQGVTIDVRANGRREERRSALRRELGLEECIVLNYAGKFNGLYYSEADYVQFMAALCNLDERVHHLIVTFPEHAGRLHAAAGAMGLQKRLTIIGPVPPEELTDYLSASDVGVIAVPPTPSQAFRTPVKSALYWAAGLPIIIPKGISDDWMIARDHHVGHVVEDLLRFDPELLRAWLSSVTKERAELRRRCTEVALKYRDTARMVEVLREALAEAVEVESVPPLPGHAC